MGTTTPALCRARGWKLHWITYAILTGELAPPEKVGHQFIWTVSDVQRAERYMAARAKGGRKRQPA